MLPQHATLGERIWHWSFRGLCGLIFLFLIVPILVIIPLSFNAEPYFTFTREMLAFDPAGFSTLIATTLGTLAALGLSRREFPFRTVLMGLLISPMVVPLIISAAGMFFFYSRIGLQGSHLGVILAHAALATPFVVITVTATLSGFDHNLTRAAASLGASPTRAFFQVTMPLITPGVVSGALFAFITSFDEVVVVLFVGSVHQRTIPWQMFSGIREQISPTILAVAALLTLVSVLLLITVEMLRRRGARLRGER